MRNPGFPVKFETGPADAIQIILTTPERHPAPDLLSELVMARSLDDLGRVLAEAAGATGAPALQISARSRTEIEIVLSAAVFSEAWHLASVFNLIDNSIFLGQEEDPFIIAGVVRSARFADASIEQLQEALAAANEAARNELNARLAAGGGETLWPDDPAEWLIDLVLQLSGTIPEGAREEVSKRFELLNALLGETAFAPDADPLVWLEEILAPYPAAAEIDERSISLAIEMPPSDPALILILFERTLERKYQVTVTRWTLELREGW